VIVFQRRILSLDFGALSKSRLKTNWPECYRAREVRFSAMLDYCASTGHQMPDDRDHGKDQEQMDQAAGDVESRESQNPKHE